MAIAVDTTTTNSTSGTATTLTTPHTCTGANLCLIVCILFYNGGSASDLITGVTYNGSSMTQLTKSTADSNITLYTYGMVGPTSGVHNVIISASSAVTIYNANVSYTGVSQSGLPDASTTKGATASPNTTTLTTIADNSWTLLWARGSTPTASTGSTLRQAVASGDTKLFDSNGAITPAGSHSMVITDGASSYTQMISIAPVIANITLTAAIGTYALTGNSVNFSIGSMWSNQTKNSSSWSNSNKGLSTWNNTSK